MSELKKIKIMPEDLITSSEDIINSEDYVVSKVMDNMDNDENVVTTYFDLGELNTENTIKTNNRDPKPPIIRVFDVAAYILNKMGSMTTMKLQKLVYYSKAWSLVWDEKPLFEEDIEAWANGPVVRELFDYHRGMYKLSAIPIGNPRLLNQEQKETVNAVLEYYGDKSSQWLIELTHMEDPWNQAREGLPRMDRGNRKISLDAMADYYSSLPDDEDYKDGG